MKRAEIDLREKIAAEIEKAANGNADMLRAIGIVRTPINHNLICPCSLCVRWEIKSCSDDCNKHRLITEAEATRFCEVLDLVKPTDQFDCGWCNNGQNRWAINQLLFDIENEFPITPCCHTEATEALDLPEPEEDGTRKDDEASYRWSVSGR
jgi:hypothetical protein